MHYYFQAFSIFALQYLFAPKSFKIAKLSTLTTQNNYLIYALLFPSIFDFCAGTFKAFPSWSE